jgi:protein-L-isoaspartate O-methyltransferase
VVLARMLQASDVKATDKVLVVGCPTGYAAAVIVQFAGQVTSAAGMPADGDAANGPYDLIVLAGATEVVPTGLYKQLAPGGQLVGVFAHQARPRRDRDPFARRFWLPAPVRRYRAGSAGHGKAPAIRFLGRLSARASGR